MNRLFARIRWGLVAWSMLILGMILALLGTAIYVAVERTMMDEVDRNLLSRTEQAMPIFFGPPGRQGKPSEGYRGGVFYIGVRGDGTVMNPQQVNVDGVTCPCTRRALRVVATIHLDGEATRVVARRMPDGGTLYRRPEPAARTDGDALAAAGPARRRRARVAAVVRRGVVPVRSGADPDSAAFQRQQEFVADASHELRTPLTVLRSATDLLNQRRQEPLDANGELFDDVRAEIARMERLAQIC